MVLYHTNNTLNIVGPTGRQIFPNVTEKRANNFSVEYTPKQSGMYTAVVLYFFSFYSSDGKIYLVDSQYSNQFF